MNEVDHPAHYQRGGIETIDYIRATLTAEQFEGYCVGNALKYLSRYKDKGGVTDLRKAYVYLGWAIEPRPVPATGRNAPQYDPDDVKFRNTENFTAWNGEQSVADADEFAGDPFPLFKVGDRVIVRRPSVTEEYLAGRAVTIDEITAGGELITAQVDGKEEWIWANSCDPAAAHGSRIYAGTADHPLRHVELQAQDERPGNLDELRAERSKPRNEGLIGRFAEAFGIGRD